MEDGIDASSDSGQFRMTQNNVQAQSNQQAVFVHNDMRQQLLDMR